MSQDQVSTEEVFDEEDDWEDGDYGIIIGPDGELKTVMFPEDLMEDPPVPIMKILKMYGIKNIHQLEAPRTLH